MIDMTLKKRKSHWASDPTPAEKTSTNFEFRGKKKGGAGHMFGLQEEGKKRRGVPISWVSHAEVTTAARKKEKVSWGLKERARTCLQGERHYF